MDASLELQAFPAHLRPAVADIAQDLWASQFHPTPTAFPVLVAGETVHIPTRVYHDKSKTRQLIRLPGEEGLFAACLGSRNCDGYLRQECLPLLLAAKQPWVAPFVVQLVGEYVLPIVEMIEKAIPQLDPAIYCAYIAENAPHYSKTQRRVISYWDVYHRAAYPALADYPGQRAIAALAARCRDAALRAPVSPILHGA